MRGIKFLKGTKASEVRQPHLHLVWEKSSLLDVSGVPHPSLQYSGMKHSALADAQQCLRPTGLMSLHLIQLCGTGVLM